MKTENQIREIAQLGAPVLREIAAPVDNVADPKVKKIMEEMLCTLASTQGVGLAAPQIGEPVRVVVIASRPTPRYPNAPDMEPTIMINPEITDFSDEMEKGWEGCLSIPGIRAQVPRHLSLTVRYLDNQGGLKIMNLDHFVARVFQHEYDHLNGTVYLDRVENNRDIYSEQEYLKLMA
ncbi:peptide deformylase [Methylicorpusculum oleiharenae]|uniref:peptide deformylase n=1 Tax=Methylicorpusculum oleiharenae TaxID=1338687 RepID=UPI001358BA11|nr:peptide deformylase [Methylicorpusculum oleiharenae]MCD2453076.1 peptide deformylase [Methylicorpusculum oleiharenae]